MKLCPFEAGDSAWLDAIQVLPHQKIYVDDRTARDANREYLTQKAEGIPCQQYYILEEAQPVGVLTLSLSPKHRFEPEGTGMCYYLGRLMIDQHMQGKGIGTQAVAAAAALCRAQIFGAAEYCYLSCNRENISGIRAYQKIGFQKLDIDYDELEDLYRLNL